MFTFTIQTELKACGFQFVGIGSYLPSPSRTGEYRSHMKIGTQDVFETYRYPN